MTQTESESSVETVSSGNKILNVIKIQRGSGQ